MFIENRAINTDRRDAKVKEDEAFALAQKTANAATQTLTNTSLLGLKIDDYNHQLTEALEAKDTKKVQAIRIEKTAAERQFLVAIVPTTYSQLFTLAQDWYRADDQIVTRRAADMQEKRNQLSKSYFPQVQQLMTTGNFLRQRLLRQLNESEGTTPQDMQWSGVFARVAAGQTIGPRELMQFSAYLHELSRRVFPDLP